MAYIANQIVKDTWTLLSSVSGRFQVRTVGIHEVYIFVGATLPIDTPKIAVNSPYRLLSDITNEYDDYTEFDYLGIGGNLYIYSKEYDTTAIKIDAGEIGKIPDRDQAGNTSFNTIFGEKTVGMRTDYINVSFQYGISDYDTIPTLSGTGYKQEYSAVASINTGLGIGAYKVTSRATNRYVTGHECLVMFTADFSVGEVNTYQRIGYGDSSDFIGFGKNQSVYGIWTAFDDGTFVHIPQSTWNTDKLDGTGSSGHILNPDKYNIYMVQFGWLGIAPIVFSIYCGTKLGWKVVHIIDGTNEAEQPHLGNPVLPITMEVGRTSGSGANVELKTSSWRASIIGEHSSSSLADRTFQVERSVTIPANTETPLITFKNKDIFKGKSNHVVSRYATVTLSSDGTKAVNFKVKKNATLTGAVYSDVDTNNSVSEKDTSATLISGGTLVGGTLLGKVDRERINLFGGDVPIKVYPNETLTLSAISTASSDLNIFLRIIEEF